MGNRGVITNTNKKIGVYLHCNGGRDSVEAFLKYCDLKGYRDLSSDPSYGFSRLCQIIGNYFGGSTSLGIGTTDRLDMDNGDNGVYIVDGWQIIEREYFEGREDLEYDFIEMLEEIDKAQPKKEQIPEKIKELKEEIEGLDKEVKK